MNSVQLLQSELFKVIEHLDDGITVSDETGHFEIFNEKMQALTGYTMKEANSVGDFTQLIYPDPQERQKALNALGPLQQEFVYQHLETTIATKDGLKKTLSVATTLFFYNQQKLFLSIYRDISARKEAEEALQRTKEELEIQAFGLARANEGIKMLYTERDKLLNSLKELSIRDSHTNLYNYRYLMERLAVEFERAKRHTLCLSVLMIDVDYLKVINDVYGHQYADEILKEFSGCLKELTRSVDILSRYGGDEFAIVLPDTDRQEAKILGERLLEGINQHIFDEPDKKLRLKVSIGLATFPEDGPAAYTAQGLIHLADQALLNAKRMGRNRLCAFGEIHKRAQDLPNNEKVGIQELKEKLQAMADRTDHTFMEAMAVFAKTIKAKENYFGPQVEHMVTLVEKMAQAMHLPAETIKVLKRAVLLYDLGKVGWPDELLKKPKLSVQEYETIKQHTIIGAELLKSVYFLDKVIPSILYHHERFDGSGYPAGLKGKEIPLGARIIGIVDAYEALISNRPYRQAYSQKEALDIIKAASGTQFDPALVDVLDQVVK